MTDHAPDNQIPAGSHAPAGAVPAGAVPVSQLSAYQPARPAPQRNPQHSSQGGKHGPSRGSGPLGTWLVIAILLLAIFFLWFLVLGIMEART